MKYTRHLRYTMEKRDICSVPRAISFMDWIKREAKKLRTEVVRTRLLLLLFINRVYSHNYVPNRDDWSVYRRQVLRRQRFFQCTLFAKPGPCSCRNRPERHRSKRKRTIIINVKRTMT